MFSFHFPTVAEAAAAQGEEEQYEAAANSGPTGATLTWTQGRVRKKAMMFPQAFGSHLLSTFKPFHPKP